MTLVVGTAGHIDHGKTALLRALTGIDADRLPEERRRGMTIDVGYAHLALADGSEIDFVDVPGHDRLVGNMLVGAGEIDAALLVVAADDGPRPQTLEHLELLDGLDLRHGLGVVTKGDLVDAERASAVAEQLAALLARSSLAAAPVRIASAATGAGLDAVRDALVSLRDEAGGPRPGPTRLAIDRVFTMRGRGVVVTGSLRGAPVEPGSVLEVRPGAGAVRVREVQVHGRTVARAAAGRVALNLVGAEVDGLHRGLVLTAGPGVEVGDRLLVALRPPVGLAGGGRPALPGRGERLRLHLGTEEVEALVAGGSDGSTVLRLEAPIAAATGDRFVLRRPSPGAPAAGGVILDVRPPRGLARRRATPERVGALAAAASARDPGAAVRGMVDLHGAVPVVRLAAVAAALGGSAPDDLLRAGPLALSADVAAVASRAALAAVAGQHRDHPLEAGMPLAALRPAVATALKRAAGTGRTDAGLSAGALVEALVVAGRLVREGEVVREPGRDPALPAAIGEAIERLEAVLAAPTPPPLEEAARIAACPPEAVRAALADGRLVRLTADVVFAAATLRELEARAVALARQRPLTPAAYRDAVGSSRKFVLAILEDLDRRGVLKRTPEGHVPGPRAIAAEPAG